MEKRNNLEAGVTSCRFCSEKAVVIDEHGVPRCGSHLDTTGSTMKSAAAEDLPAKHTKR